ncbi:MAG TPA: hypothetical protein VGK63_00470 [Candidatus Limnocylindrales bacterium]
MAHRRSGSDLSSAAQEYLLALRVMEAAPGERLTVSHVGRRLGVSTQAAS